jgi:hypothetical protein
MKQSSPIIPPARFHHGINSNKIFGTHREIGCNYYVENSDNDRLSPSSRAKESEITDVQFTR